MRWDELFADLEGQLEAAEGAELAAEVADRTRHEAAQLWLVDRARARRRARRSRCTCAGPDRSAGAWPRRGGVAARLGGGRPPGPGAGRGRAVRGRAGRLHGRRVRRAGCSPASGWVRRCARSPATGCRSSVGLVDGGAVTGTVDRVGADFVEVAEHGAGEPRRQREVSGMRTVPFAAIAIVRSG